MPGEVSPAYHGMLFLNAWPEFRRHVYEAWGISTIDAELSL